MGNKIRIIFFVLILLQGCASSNVSREASGQFHNGYQNGSHLFGSADDKSLAESYQNTSQTTKGVLIGGAAGAVAGWMTSGVGVLPGAAGGAIFGGALGAYIDANTSLTDQIINRGNKIIILGDQVLIVMPSRHLFKEESAEIRPQAYSTLDKVAKLINGYPNMTVEVAGYTSSAGPDSINLGLSQQQANNIQKYLWYTGVNTRLLYAAGYGGMRPVDKSCTDWDHGDNYRIEIKLEKLPV